jgi:hypothetical protein
VAHLRVASPAKARLEHWACCCCCCPQGLRKISFARGSRRGARRRGAGTTAVDHLRTMSNLKRHVSYL